MPPSAVVTPLTKEERRARREARREQQRAQNIVRAKAMHTARLAASTKQGGSRPKRSPPTSKKAQLYIGCSGWFYWHWRDGFYPTGLPTNRWFEHYTTHFKTVELNAPFYSWPTVATVQTWLKQAGRRRFVYTVKVNELITHTKRFAGTATLVQDFYHIADLLGDRLGCFLFQLPPSFHYTPARLKRILTQLDPTRPNVVEFRHRTWWNETVYDAFEERGITFCSCSGPRLPDDLVKTTDQLYVRFHGLKKWYRHDYTREELAHWATRIRQSGARKVWVYFNNDRDRYAIKNARELARQLKRL